MAISVIVARIVSKIRVPNADKTINFLSPILASPAGTVNIPLVKNIVFESGITIAPH